MPTAKEMDSNSPAASVNSVTIRFSSFYSGDVAKASSVFDMPPERLICAVVVVGIVTLIAAILCSASCCCCVSLEFLLLPQPPLPVS